MYCQMRTDQRDIRPEIWINSALWYRWQRFENSTCMWEEYLLQLWLQVSPRCHLFRLSHPEVQCRLFPRYRLVRLSAQCHSCHLFPPVYLVPQCHQIMIGMNFFYFEFGYSVGDSLVFGFTIMYGLGTLISEASFAWLSSKWIFQLGCPCCPVFGKPIGKYIEYKKSHQCKAG